MLNHLRDPQVAVGILGVGAAAIIAGVALLALSVGVDDRWAYGAIAAGIPIALIGFLLLMFGPVKVRLERGDSRRQSAAADHHSAAATGDVRSDNQSGGQTANIIYNSQGPQETPISPVLQLSEPENAFGQEVPLYDNNNNLVTNAFIWRVKLENLAEGTKASNVAITLDRSDPLLPVLPVDLHKFHDDTAPYTRRHEVRFGEPVILDLIAVDFRGGIHVDVFFLWRSDLPASYAYVYPLSPEENDIVRKGIQQRIGFLLTVKAVADPPTKLVEQTYKMHVDRDGCLVVEAIHLS